MQITSIIASNLYPIVESSMQKNHNNFKKCVGRYISLHSTELYDTGPNTRIIFGKIEYDDFYKSIGIQESDIIDILKNCYFWDMNFNPAAAKDPLTETVLMIIRYYILNNNIKDAELASIYLAFSGKFYPSIHYGSFPNVVPQENRAVMDYVVNNKLTNQSALKVEGSVFGAIRSIVITWINTYKSDFKKPDDEKCAYFIQQLHNRIKSFMINIASSFYESYDNKDYLNFESDNQTDSGKFRIVENNSTMAARWAENAMQYIANHDIDYAICVMCADENIRKDEIRGIMESILKQGNYLREVREVIDILISDYIKKSKNMDVSSIEFISLSIKAKPNTKQKDILRMQYLIEHWLDENSPAYRKRKSRLATKNSYHRAVLQYIVLIINKSNK